MKKIFEKWKWLQVTIGLAFFIVGIVIACLIWVKDSDGGTSTSDALHSSIGYILASLILLVGIALLAVNIIQKPMKIQMSFMAAVLFISLGGFLLYFINTLEDKTLFGTLFIILSSVFFLSLALFTIIWGIRKLLSDKKKKLMPVLAFILSAVLIGVGITVAIMIKNEIFQNLGVCLAGLGIAAIGTYLIVELILRITGERKKAIAQKKIVARTEETAEIQETPEISVEELIPAEATETKEEDANTPSDEEKED